MALVGAILLFMLIGGAGALYARHVTARVAAVAPPRAARTAKGAQRQAARGRQMVSGKAAEIWAEAHSADWLERQRARRTRRAARTPVSQHASRAARLAGRGIGKAGAATGRGATRLKQRVLVPQGTIPPLPGSSTATPGSQSNVRSLRPSQPASPPAQRETPQMTTPNGTSSSTGTARNGSAPIGGGADLFTAMQQVTGHAMSGGLRSKQRSISVLSESFDYMASQLESFARQLSEPGLNYPAQVWEALSRGAAHLKAAASASGESSSSLNAIAAMNVGELADSPVRAPHHDELNAAS
jgi:hypothetical protein